MRPKIFTDFIRDRRSDNSRSDHHRRDDSRAPLEQRSAQDSSAPETTNPPQNPRRILHVNQCLVKDTAMPYLRQRHQSRCTVQQSHLKAQSPAHNSTNNTISKSIGPSSGQGLKPPDLPSTNSPATSPFLSRSAHHNAERYPFDRDSSYNSGHNSSFSRASSPVNPPSENHSEQDVSAFS